PINNKPNGGSSALDGCLTRLHFADFEAIRNKRPIGRYAIWKIESTLKLLLERGAQWIPEEQELTLEVVKRLRNPTTMGSLQALVQPKRMREHLAGHEQQFLHFGLDIRTAAYKAAMEEQATERRLYALQRLAKEYSREQLYEDVWTTPM